MLDNITICKKLEILIKYYNEFQQLTNGITINDYIDNIVIKRAIERVMQLIVECATDINNMILKKQGKGPSRDYYNSFIDLAENNVMDMEFAVRIAPSTGLRNILVHEYQKIIEIFNHQVNIKYPLDTSTTHFDCTNFYFEIDKENEFRKKGPSKENRHDPIIGLGLLLDANQIPIGMKLYPGNESEKPVIRDIIKELKEHNQISGKTVRVADKGINCAENIIDALKNNDGYLFSKSVKQLPETEKTWVLLKDGYKKVTDSNGTLLYLIKECIDEFPYTYTDENGKKHTVRLKEKRVATYNPKLSEKKKYEIKKMVEKAKMLKACQAKKSEFGECSKYVTFGCADKKGNAIDGKVKVEINRDAILKDLKLAGYNLLVTSEIKMKADDIYSTYHNLWRIEESFKVMKSYLDARPVFLQKTASIHGHFLICYLAVLLIRLLQFKVLKNKYCTEKIIDFIRKFRIVKLEHNKYVNITSSSKFIKSLADELKLPITNYFLNESQIKKMLNYKF
jgi:transposase